MSSQRLDSISLRDLDSIENRAKKLISDTAIVKAKLQSRERRRKVACLCAAALHDLLPFSPFHIRGTRRK